MNYTIKTDKIKHNTYIDCQDQYNLNEHKNRINNNHNPNYMHCNNEEAAVEHVLQHVQKLHHL